MKDHIKALRSAVEFSIVASIDLPEDSVELKQHLLSFENIDICLSDHLLDLVYSIYIRESGLFCCFCRWKADSSIETSVNEIELALPVVDLRHIRLEYIRLSFQY